MIRGKIKINSSDTTPTWRRLKLPNFVVVMSYHQPTIHLRQTKGALGTNRRTERLYQLSSATPVAASFAASKTPLNASEIDVRMPSFVETKRRITTITAANIMYSNEEAPFCCFLGVAFLIRATAALSSFITDYLWLTVVNRISNHQATNSPLNIDQVIRYWPGSSLYPDGIYLLQVGQPQGCKIL